MQNVKVQHYASNANLPTTFGPMEPVKAVSMPPMDVHIVAMRLCAYPVLLATI